jgi:ribosomal protein L1
MEKTVVIERVEGEVVFSSVTGKNVKITVVASGEWSGRDIENLYELLGHQLRNGSFDPAPVKRKR